MTTVTMELSRIKFNRNSIFMCEILNIYDPKYAMKFVRFNFNTLRECRK